MNESSDYPVKIDLGRQEPDYSGEIASKPSDKKRKMRTVYPTLYIDGGSELAKLEKEGYALIKYKRKKVSIGDDSYGGSKDGAEDKASAVIEVQEICVPDQSGDIMDEFKKFAKGKGVDTGDSTPAESDADDEGSEEEET